jgi:hypothetical protein
MFAFWLCAPRVAFWSIHRTWPPLLFLDTVYPFHHIDTYLSHLSVEKRIIKALGGAVVALPFLLVFGSLFASADPFFRKTIADLFRDVQLGPTVGKTIRDLIVGFYLVAGGWTMYLRLQAERLHDPAHEPSHPSVASLATFLGLLNALFLLFIGFQIPYFFGGEAFIKSQDLVYAEYARHGFFQLITVAGIVFVISWAVYAFTHMRERWSRLLTIGLVVETGVVLASAVTRLLLYVDAYGLSLSRWWALVSVFIIAVTLSILVIGAALRTAYNQIAKTLCVVILLISALPLLYNTEATIVRINTQRYLSGQTDIFDVNYLTMLSSDAVPELVDAMNGPLPSKLKQPEIDVLRARLDYLKRELEYQSHDWRNLVISDYRAIAALKSVPAVSTVQPPTSTARIEPLTNEDIAWIKRNIDGGTMPQGIGRLAKWSVPSRIASAQFRNAYFLTDGTAFGLMFQPNMNIPLLDDTGHNFEGSIALAGVLFTQDDGKTWHMAFNIPTDLADADGLLRYNPVGMFIDKGRYYLDIADARGAGSGEGNLVRYSTVDGKDWKREKCYYFVPENYYNHEPGLRSPNSPPGGYDPITDPNKLKPIVCPGKTP